VIGTAGRLSPEKGTTQLIDAARRVTQEQAGTGVVIFGEGPLRDELARQIATLGLEGRVVLAGFRNDLDQWLGALDIFALPSFTEGLPNVVLEAFAARVPVVATAVGGTPEVVEHGVNGFLVPAGDSVVLAQRLLELLTNAPLARRMGQLGLERVQREFAFAAQADQYRQLFSCLLRVPHRSRAHTDVRMAHTLTGLTE
jgi:glycosyltransferase involved in cell wall biosynthesis